MIRLWLAASSAVGRAGLGALALVDGLAVVGASDLGPGLSEAVAGGIDVLVVAADGPWAAALARLDGLVGAAVVVVGGAPGDVAVLDALPLRGWAVVPDDAADTADALSGAIGAAAAGFVAVPGGPLGRWVSGSVAGASAPGGARPEPAGEGLTPREREVLARVALGESNRQIARALGVSEHTVKFHLGALFAKLGASSRTEAVTVGLRRGHLAL